MSYETVSEALQDIIAGGELELFEEKDTSLGDWGICSGSHRYVAIVDYAGLQQGRNHLEGGYLLTWQLDVYLGVPYIDDKQVHDDLRDIRQEVLTEVGENPGLGISLYNAEVTGGEDIPEVFELGEGQWSFETVRVEATELVDYEEAD